MGKHMAKRHVSGWRSSSLAALAVCLLMSVTTASQAGNFAVSPIRLDYDSANINGAITITNAAETELRVQISLYEWRQDEHGKDLYTPSDDLLYFPHLATIAPAARQLVRAGLRQPASSDQERSYRLFVEELPDSKAISGTRLAVAVRFGVPLFVKPQQESVRGEITSLSMDKGVLHVVVANSGNTHFKISTVAATAEAFTQQVSGWYLLPGVSREYQITVPTEACIKSRKLSVVVDTDRVKLEKSLEIEPSMCKGS